MTPGDNQLIKQYLEGDSAAFEVLYDRYARRLPGFIRSLGADEDSAQDTAQKVWLKVLKAFERFDGRGLFRAWLFTVAHRTWIDECRGKWSRGRVSLNEENEEIETPDHRSDPREQAAASQQVRRIEKVLQALPEEMRQVVLLRVDGELTFQQIARELDCPLGTVLWRMKEARKKLRKEILE